LWERNARPGANGPGQNFLDLVIEDDTVHALPIAGMDAPLLGAQLSEMLDALGGHEHHEHLLAMPVCLIVKPLNAAPAKQRLLNSAGRRTSPGEPVLVVEQLGSL